MSVEFSGQEPTPGEVNCGNCVGACCRAGAGLMLSEAEYDKHKRAMNLKAIVKPKYFGQFHEQDIEDYSENGARIKSRVKMSIPPKHGFYIMLDNCGNLTQDSKCAIYEGRPAACVSYEMGSAACLAARATFGLDGHEATVPLERDTPLKIRIPRYHQA